MLTSWELLSLAGKDRHDKDGSSKIPKKKVTEERLVIRVGQPRLRWADARCIIEIRNWKVAANESRGLAEEHRGGQDAIMGWSANNDDDTDLTTILKLSQSWLGNLPLAPNFK